jgi:hypothetical protein
MWRTTGSRRGHGQQRSVGACGRPGGGRAVPAGGDPAPLHLHHGRDLVAAAALRTDPAQAGVPPDDPSALSRRVRFLLLRADESPAMRELGQWWAHAQQLPQDVLAAALPASGGSHASDNAAPVAGGRRVRASPPAGRQIGFGVTLAYVALGSNLGDPRQQVLDAMEALASCRIRACCSVRSLYRTPPWGVLEQPPFVNAAVQVDTALSPYALLDALAGDRTTAPAGACRAQRAAHAGSGSAACRWCAA